MLWLQQTTKPNVYLVVNAPSRANEEYVAREVERLIAHKWPCPIEKYGATRYCVRAARGRKNKGVFYAEVLLS